MPGSCSPQINTDKLAPYGTDGGLFATDVSDVQSHVTQKLAQISTRRVAVYRETHCNIGSKRALPTGVLDSETTVYLFTDATLHSCHAYISLFTFAS